MAVAPRVRNGGCALGTNATPKHYKIHYETVARSNHKRQHIHASTNEIALRRPPRRKLHPLPTTSDPFFDSPAFPIYDKQLISPVPLDLLQVVANCTYQPRKTAARFGVDPTQISTWLPPMVLPQSALQLESAHSLSGRQPKSLGVMMVLCFLATAHSPVHQHRSSTRRE